MHFLLVMEGGAVPETKTEDNATGTYYLRARYYDPAIGCFTQADTHWNTSNMIYGDNPQKINEREDKLGLRSYSYAPQITAVMQAGNLYVYCCNNPVVFLDKTGDYDDALDDFNSLELKNVTIKEDGTIVGETSDGRIVNVRNHSSSGSPTLEVYDPATGKSIKIRYK